MTSMTPPSGENFPFAPSSFAQRAPSQSWEAYPLDPAYPGYVWVWFKPSEVAGLLLWIPDEVSRDPQWAGLLSMRRLLFTAGVDPALVAAWQLHGHVYDAMHGAAPLLDQPVPPPVPGIDPTIVVYVADRPSVGVPPMVPAVPAEEMTIGHVFETIEADWSASLETEIQLKIVRKRLSDLFVRIKSLNRDLSGDERVHSNNQDKKDWQDARRALRDAENRLTMMTKQYDIGDTSTAGQRTQFEETYERYIQPRIPFEGLRQSQRDYAIYRKSVTTLQTSMNATYAQCSMDAERRAQQVLKRIADKIRQATIKKNFLGVVTD